MFYYICLVIFQTDMKNQNMNPTQVHKLHVLGNALLLHDKNVNL